MPHDNLVSVIIIFLNAADFLKEAVESVLAQTYHHWELFLVDDGSTDISTQIAHQYAALYPGKVIYLDHPDHKNLGKGASRNLGLRHARGEYVAFLDADDIWLPNKLEEQTEILSSYPEAGMLYGNTLYWHSWTGRVEDTQKDFIPKLGVQTDTLLKSPSLLLLYIRGRAAVPCTCSVLIKQKVIEEVKGFVEDCQGISNFYEDQAFYAKICLAAPVVAKNCCWDKYRQRSSTRNKDVAKRDMQEYIARKSFLNWLDEYITKCGIDEIDIRLAIQKELWLQQVPGWLPNTKMIRNRIRWIKKWILRLEESIFPASISSRLWIRN